MTSSLGLSEVIDAVDNKQKAKNTNGKGAASTTIRIPDSIRAIQHIRREALLENAALDAYGLNKNPNNGGENKTSNKDESLTSTIVTKAMDIQANQVEADRKRLQDAEATASAEREKVANLREAYIEEKLQRIEGAGSQNPLEPITQALTVYTTLGKAIHDQAAEISKANQPPPAPPIVQGKSSIDVEIERIRDDSAMRHEQFLALMKHLENKENQDQRNWETEKEERRQEAAERREDRLRQQQIDDRRWELQFGFEQKKYENDSGNKKDMLGELSGLVAALVPTSGGGGDLVSSQPAPAPTPPMVDNFPNGLPKGFLCGTCGGVINVLSQDATTATCLKCKSTFNLPVPPGRPLTINIPPQSPIEEEVSV